MKSILNLCSVVSTLTLSTLAFGQTALVSPAAVKKPLDPSNFSFVLKLQDRFSLLDTTRGTAFDSFSEVVRVGVNYNYNRLLGSIVLQYDGGSAETGGATRIRQGNLKYKILNSASQSLVVGAGREHLASAVIYAPDAFSSLYATTLDNFNAGQDGLDLYYTQKSDQMNYSVGAGIFNTLGVRTFATNGYLSYSSPISSSSTNAGTNYNKASFSENRAYVLQARADMPVAQGTLQANALYGMQKNAPMEASATASARDVAYFEGSLGYSALDKSLSAGAWYQNTRLGKLVIRSNPTEQGGANYAYSSVESARSSDQTTVGLGAKGTGKLFGWTGWTGDAVDEFVTFGASYQHMHKVVSATSYAYDTTASVDPLFSSPKSNVDAVNLAVGYVYSVASVELNYVAMGADNSPFYSNTDLTADKKNTASLVYLTGIINL